MFPAATAMRPTSSISVSIGFHTPEFSCAPISKNPAVSGLEISQAKPLAHCVLSICFQTLHSDVDEHLQHYGQELHRAGTTSVGVHLKVDSHYHALSVHARNVSVQPKYYYMDFTSPIHTIRHVPYRARSCTARSGFGFSRRIFCRTVLCMNVNERAWTGIVNYLPTR